MSKNEEIAGLKDALMTKIKKENDSRYVNLSPDEIIKIVIDASLEGKYVFWVFREYLKGNIHRFEDMSRAKQALTLFKNNLSKFTEQQKQLNKMSFGELENLVSPYQDILTQNEIKRMNKEKIWAEIETIYEGPEGKIYIPRTEQASIFLGQGTKWCTASANGENYFEHYNKQGPLYILITPEKDEKGREIKYQLHFESGQLMDMQDQATECEANCFLSKLTNILIENLSVKQKIKHFFFTDSGFFDFGFSGDLNNVLFVEKAKISGDISDMPDELRTKELCELIIQQYGLALVYVPEKFKTKELCELAVQQDRDALYYVPWLTKELCELAVRNDGSALCHVPENFQTKELCEIAVQQNGLSLQYVLEECMTKELCGLAVKQNGRALYSVPQEFKTKELCELAVRQHGCSLRFVPVELKTKELCDLAVKKNGSALEHVPQEFRTKEFCELAVMQDGNALCGVPWELRTKELCKLAIQQNGLALGYIPEKFITYELCELAVQQNGYALCYVPTKLITKEFCWLAVEKKGLVLEYVPDQYKTYELCEIAVKQDGQALEYIPGKFSIKEFLEIHVKAQNNRNNMNYSLEEVSEMFFSKYDNQVRKIYKNVEIHPKQYYIELRSEQLSLEFATTQKYND